MLLEGCGQPVKVNYEKEVHDSRQVSPVPAEAKTTKEEYLKEQKELLSATLKRELLLQDPLLTKRGQEEFKRALLWRHSFAAKSSSQTLSFASEPKHERCSA